MKRLFPILIIIILTGCNWDERTEVKHLTKEFNLGWWSEAKYQSLFLNSDRNEYGGVVLIRETVYEIGYDDNFIVAKQHPNKEEEVSDRLFNRDSTGYYRLSEPADTIYLSGEDSVFQINGHYYHISNGWNPPDSLFPYVDSTYYYIVDIRNYDYNNWFERNILFQYPMFDGYEVYEFDNETDFIKKRIELDVPNYLKFERVYKQE